MGWLISLLDWWEERIRKRKHRTFQSRTGEKYILIRLNICGHLRIPVRMIFYFVLITATVALGNLMKTENDVPAWVVYGGLLLFLGMVVGYEFFDSFLVSTIERLKRKAYRKHGVGYNKPFEKKEKK